MDFQGGNMKNRVARIRSLKLVQRLSFLVDKIRHNKIAVLIRDNFELWFIGMLLVSILVIVTQTDFTIIDPEVHIFILRMVHSLIVLFVVVEIFRCTGYIDNYRVSRMFWVLTKWLFVFFIARILAGIADSLTSFSVSWFSNNVSLLFWTVLYLKTRKARLVLCHSKNTEQRVRFREICDSLIDQMDQARENARRTIKSSQI